MPDSLPSVDQLELLEASPEGITHEGLRKNRGPGRPPGSTNKKNDKIGQLILQEYGDPLLSQAKAAFMPVDLLTSALRAADQETDGDELDRIEGMLEKLNGQMTKADAGRVSRALSKYLAKKKISVLDVWKEQNSIKATVTTYVYGKQPLTVQLTNRKDAVILMPGFNVDGDMSMDDIKSMVDEKGIENIDFTGMKQIEGAAVEKDSPDDVDAS